jgi:hypothetical protein
MGHPGRIYPEGPPTLQTTTAVDGHLLMNGVLEPLLYSLIETEAGPFTPTVGANLWHFQLPRSHHRQNQP